MTRHLFALAVLVFLTLVSTSTEAQVQVDVVDMIPNALSNETTRDSEPNIAVNPSNRLQIAASAFTPDPAGSGSGPIFVSTDGGNNWALNVVLPGGNRTVDVTLKFASTSNVLYGGILRQDNTNLNILRKANFTAAGNMVILINRANDDQPWVEAVTTAGGGNPDRVFVSNNDTSLFPGLTATIDQSQNAATAAAPAGFGSVRIEPRTNCNQDGPAVRTAIHPGGRIYAAYQRWTACGAAPFTSDIVVARDNNFGTGATPYQAITDPGDGQAGVIVATGVSIPWGSNLGTQRIGSQLAIAVDPNNNQRVFLAWADGTGAANYTIHVRSSTDGGANWSADLRAISPATNPGLAIAATGRVGLLYQQLTGAAPNQRWQTHFEFTDDGFATAPTDIVLANVADANGAYAGSNPIGDYANVVASGPHFYGVFAGNNTPNPANFPNGITFLRNVNQATQQLRNTTNTANVAVSIDPFFFSVKQPPVANAGGPYVTDEGTPVMLNGSGTPAPGAGPLTFDWDFDNNGVFGEPTDASGPNPSFTNVVQNGFFPVTLRVTDTDGATDTDATMVTVQNVPPTVDAGPDLVGIEDEPIGLTATFTDPGVNDTHTAVIDWGDTVVEPGAVTQGAGSGSVDGSHTYSDPGVYTVTVTVTDSDGDMGSDTTQVTVVHGFLKYCLFGFGDRKSLFFGDRVHVRSDVVADCGAGGFSRIRLARNVEMGGEIQSIPFRVRIGRDDEITGDVDAGDRVKIKDRSEVNGDVVAIAEDIRLRRDATVNGDATAGGQVLLRSGASVTGAIQENAVVLPPPPLTTVTLSLSAGGADVDIGRNQTRTLVPASYGVLRGRKGSTLELSSGTYEFQRFKVDRESTINLDLSGGPIIIDVIDRLRLGRRTRVVVTSAVGGAEDILVQFAGRRRGKIKRDSEVLGTFLAPDADLRVGRGTLLEGGIYGRKVKVHRRAEITANPALVPFISLYVP